MRLSLLVLTKVVRLVHTSCIDPDTTRFLQLRHASSKQATQLRSAADCRGSWRIHTALVTVAPSSVPRHRWCEASWWSCHSGHGRCTSHGRRSGAAGDIADYRRGSVICDGFLQGSPFADVGKKGALARLSAWLLDDKDGEFPVSTHSSSPCYRRPCWKSARRRRWRWRSSSASWWRRGRRWWWRRHS